ncbi:hypothetical protein AMECASPLE_022214 [Ameca splendens]
MWATSVSAGQGYTPEPSDLEQLMKIDSKIRLLFPAEEFHSLQSSYTDLSMSQAYSDWIESICTSTCILCHKF